MKFFVSLCSALFLLASAYTFAGDTLQNGQTLNAGERITSSNGDYSLRMQQDGNLVLYKNAGTVPLWATYTQGNSGARAVMQTDGNLVVYSSTNGVLWAAHTTFNYYAKLVVQSDGNLVIYKQNGDPIWYTDTVQEVCTTKSIDHWGGTVVSGTAQWSGAYCAAYVPLIPEPGPFYEPMNNGQDICVLYPPYAGKFPVEVCE